jgi:Protein of unknown function (DUF3892)
LATYSIARVHLVPSAGAIPHQHIGSVMLTDGRIVQRFAVIASIRAGDRWYTNATPPAQVYVHRCPSCGANDYITTHPDDTTTNNLLKLPRF